MEKNKIYRSPNQTKWQGRIQLSQTRSHIDLKKLDARISGLSRTAKKKLLEKHLILTNDNFLWLQPTQKEISNIDALPEIPQPESKPRRP